MGNQSLGLTEVAYQNAVAYAKDRIQMRSLSGPKAPDKPADPIIVHPDVRKMLLTARAYAEGARALAIYWWCCSTRPWATPTKTSARTATEMVALLTPIIKAFLTDNGWTATSHCMQVFGGHGYIHEWGMEQFVRDARINMIYEGTNTIQSPRPAGPQGAGNNGATLQKAFGKKVGDFVGEGVNEAMARVHQPAGRHWATDDQVHTELGMKASRTPTKWAPLPWTTCVVGHLVFGYFFGAHGPSGA